jgi:seryl-tRNA synthetase
MLEHRGDSADLDSVRALDERRRDLISQVESLRAERNVASKAIGLAKREGRDAAAEMAAVGVLGDKQHALEAELSVVENELDTAMMMLPNMVQPEVPYGQEGEGEVVKLIGEKPSFDFEPKDHLDIAAPLGLIDMERGARTSGSRFAYILGDMVRLQFALVQLAIDRLSAAGFNPVVPPVLVREDALWNTGFFPTDRSQIYHAEGDDLYLVGTSEVPLAAMHAGEILDADQLPIRYVGISSCFRREAGAAGKDTRGLFRVHQFDKVEMFSFVAPDPETSSREHDFLLEREEELMGALGFHYRVVNIPAGDLGASASKKYDIEVWLPGQQRYAELTSTSNCTDYQARRLRARVRGEKGNEILHTLNGTAFAIGRTLIAILEYGQQADGTVKIPEVLHQYGAPAQLGKSRATA